MSIIRELWCNAFETCRIQQFIVCIQRCWLNQTSRTRELQTTRIQELQTSRTQELQLAYWCFSTSTLVLAE